MDSNILGAFGEDQVSDLTKLSRAQLRAWNRRGFIRPEYFQGNSDKRSPFAYIYSFKDLLKLRVLNQLRNIYNVPMKELIRVERELAHLGDDKWTNQRLWVLNRRVVFEEPESSKKREIASKQFVAEIPLEVVTSDARNDIRRLNERSAASSGKIVSKKHLHSSNPVLAGTRIPVSAIAGYLNAGYTAAAIIEQFPGLTVEDIKAASRYGEAA
jgi:uncharacterized protein (DUF433 family)